MLTHFGPGAFFLFGVVLPFLHRVAAEGGGDDAPRLPLPLEASGRVVLLDARRQFARGFAIEWAAGRIVRRCLRRGRRGGKGERETRRRIQERFRD